MSVLKFELKKGHVELLKHLEWGDLEDATISTIEKQPFGDYAFYDDMGVILYGKPEEFDPFEGNPFQWTPEQVVEMENLMSELPRAIEVVLNSQSFEPGLYKTRFSSRIWKKIK